MSYIKFLKLLLMWLLDTTEGGFVKALLNEWPAKQQQQTDSLCWNVTTAVYNHTNNKSTTCIDIESNKIMRFWHSHDTYVLYCSVWSGIEYM